MNFPLFVSHIMKYFLILMLSFGFVGFSIIAEDVYGLVIPLSPDELYEQSQTIFVGNITSINDLEFEKSSTSYIEKGGIETQTIEQYTLSLDEYTVNVEEFVKNPQDSAVMKVRQPTTSLPGRDVPIGGFELGDRVLFYIQNLDDVNEYSLESFKIPLQCDAKTILQQPRIELKNSFEIFQDRIAKDDNYTEGIPMKFNLSKDIDTLYGGSIDVVVSIRKEGNNQVLFEKNIHSELEPCNWITSATWEFTPEEGNYRMYLNVKENEKNGGSESYTGFTVISKPEKNISPLKQIKSGVALIDVQCSEGKVPSYKGDRMRVACVSEETQIELWTRGWATMRLISPGENISHALCNNYEGKWHPKYEGCREVTDLQCSLMGGKFVDGLKICYNEICPEDKTYTLCMTNPDIWDDSWSVGNWTVDDFEDTFGGLGNRHPAFLGYYIPEICSEDIVKHLVRYSSMFDKGVPYVIQEIGLPDGVDIDDFNQCVEILLEIRDDEPSWNRK